MKKKIVSVLVLLFIPILLLSCKNNDSEKSDKVKVVTSIYPMKEFTEVIGGDKVEVISLIPDNVEPHDYEPNTKDYEELIKADLFIYNGLGMEEWLDDVKEQLKDNITYVNASDKVSVIKEGKKKDPHAWLSLLEAKNQCETIKNALVKADKDNEEYYEKNYEDYTIKLQDLYNEYDEKNNNINTNKFVTSHAAFGYLCRDFGLKQSYLHDMFGEGEITAKEYENLAKYCTDNNISTIFSEQEESSKEAETLANEINGKVVPLYTLETKVEGKSYLEVMKSDLDTIYTSLKK